MVVLESWRQVNCAFIMHIKTGIKFRYKNWLGVDPNTANKRFLWNSLKKWIPQSWMDEIQLKKLIGSQFFCFNCKFHSFGVEFSSFNCWLSIYLQMNFLNSLFVLNISTTLNLQWWVSIFVLLVKNQRSFKLCSG